MRVMIWGDMEGVACVTSWEQVSGGAVQYQECRVLYTKEMNAAARAAKRAGATEIYAVDNHGAGGGFSFNDVFPMESRLTAAQCGRDIASHALKLVADPLAAPRRRRSSTRQAEE